MKSRILASALVGLAVSAIAPALATAADRYDRSDRYSDRSGRDIDANDFDRNINMNDVPERVMETVRRERPRNKIESVQHVRHHGREFFRFRFDGKNGQEDLILRVLRDGSVLSTERVEDTGRGGPHDRDNDRTRDRDRDRR